MKKAVVKKEILSVGVSDASQEVIMHYVFDFLKETKEKMMIVTPNPEIIMYARSHESYRKILNQAGLSLCDGMGLFLAGKILNRVVPERISGVDFMERLCKESINKAVNIGFLGGRGGVAERTADCLISRYPGLMINFVGEEWNRSGFTTGKTYLESSISYIEEKKLDTKYKIQNTDVIDILFVAYGFPKQEEWMHEHLEKLPVRIMMGVGGSFDILSGDISRAPAFMRGFGLEWLYRLIRQPWRIKRQLILPQFLFTVLKERLLKS